MAKPPYIELGQGPAAERIPILYEDRAVIAVDKPRHWMLVPFTWQKTDRNLQAAIQSSIGAGAFWARSRHVRFLRYVHRLDADTTGILLFAKSPGGTQSLGDLFESRRMHKRYLAVVRGTPPVPEWTATHRLDKDPAAIGRMRVVRRDGKDAETTFRILDSRNGLTLLEALPVTGRTHQIRVHLAADGFPILGDELYGTPGPLPLALRAVELQYQDPFTRRPVRIRASIDAFLREYGFAPAATQTPSTTSPAAVAGASAGDAGREPRHRGPANSNGPRPQAQSQAKPRPGPHPGPHSPSHPKNPDPARPAQGPGPGKSQTTVQPHGREHGGPDPRFRAENRRGPRPAQTPGCNRPRRGEASPAPRPQQPPAT